MSSTGFTNFGRYSIRIPIRPCSELFGMAQCQARAEKQDHVARVADHLFVVLKKVVGGTGIVQRLL